MKKLTPRQKASIVLAVLKGEKISKLAGLYQVHPQQITRWKKLFDQEMLNIFTDKRKKDNYNQERIMDELYKTIGQREMEISWLKKKLQLDLPRKISFDR